MPVLKQEQLKRLEKKLLDRQRVLVDEVNAKRHDTASASTEEAIGGVGDPGDESVARMQTDLNFEEAGRDSDELRDIEAALARMADGTYGICDDCGGEIDSRRLEAQPTAVRCIECQAKHEKTFAHKATPTL